MKRELMIKGNSIDEKIKSIELALRRMSRRLNTKVIGVMPVSPVFNFTYTPDSEGVIARMIFPSSGTVTKGALHFGTSGTKPITLKLEVVNDILGEASYKTLIVKRRSSVLELDYEVKGGDRMTVHAEVAEGEEFNGLWFGVLYEVTPSKLRKKDFLLEELENMIQEDVDSADED